jgi:hypothetical protein
LSSANGKEFRQCGEAAGVGAGGGQGPPLKRSTDSMCGNLADSRVRESAVGWSGPPKLSTAFCPVRELARPPSGVCMASLGAMEENGIARDGA